MPSPDHILESIFASECDKSMTHAEATMIGNAQVKSGGSVSGRQGTLLTNSNKIAAQKFAENLRPALLRLGIIKKAELVRELNRRGVPAPRGGKWHVTSLRRVLKRLEPSLSQEFKARRSNVWSESVASFDRRFKK